jgi:hypothetical protein
MGKLLPKGPEIATGWRDEHFLQGSVSYAHGVACEAMAHHMSCVGLPEPGTGAKHLTRITASDAVNIIPWRAVVGPALTRAPAGRQSPWSLRRVRIDAKRAASRMADNIVRNKKAHGASLCVRDGSSTARSGAPGPAGCRTRD